MLLRLIVAGPSRGADRRDGGPGEPPKTRSTRRRTERTHRTRAVGARFSTRYVTLTDGMATSAGSALSLIKAVLEIVADRGTGLLDVRSEGLPTRIYFADGKPVFAEDEALGESFGRLLMRKGVISNAEFVR